MNSRSALILFFLIFNIGVSNAQQIISGKITDSETGKAVVAANIYINNTTIRTISDSNGLFKLDNIP
ncbi:carboxypeptidase-like regulatory domain-containing protein [Pedobacter frigoris]|uniref:Carboxypeptidase-like regulatory domain-containing protein n=1 Tax=Pedobacter frigoris TaxID=2571272 RepID=A0A4U1CCF2_9SPHI|nr:carboxypeptidase-like regulatory domain-containing protein [Pedobacter frigoris]TKC02857.1 carboxypeptidase-like regulatory domain-containing protein [Pedobacter frigoris]